jgi:competence protein ComFB
MMAVVNVTQMLVKHIFAEQFVQHCDLMCDCPQCRDDIMAMTLNHLPTRYVSTNRGEAYVKAQYFDPQLQSDIIRELTVSAKVVGQRPNHSPDA